MKSIDVQKAFGYLFEEEIDTLHELSKDRKNILQIGAGAGTSSLAILEESNAHLTTIDIRKESNPFGSLEAEKQVVAKAGFLDRLTQIHGDSKEKVKELNAIYDMVFIDGGHSYNDCKRDIMNCVMVLVPNGFLVIHDYKKENAYNEVIGKAPHPKPLPGVTKAVDVLLIPYYERIVKTRSLIAFKITHTVRFYQVQ